MHELLTHVYAPPKESAIGDSEHTSALDQTLELMELGYAEHLSREVLAGVAGMSVWHYSRVFKNRTGISPMEYVNSIRMDRAKEMLLVPGQTIKHIASQVGFQDEFYFSRKFKNMLACLPLPISGRNAVKLLLSPSEPLAICWHCRSSLMRH